MKGTLKIDAEFMKEVMTAVAMHFYGVGLADGQTKAEPRPEAFFQADDIFLLKVTNAINRRDRARNRR